MVRPLVIVALAAGIAGARPARRADNMPRGWAWPPTRTMLDAARQCETRLDELGVTWEPAKRAGHVVDPITVTDGQIGGIAYVDVYDQKPPVMDCQLVLALATFAPRMYELGIREVRIGGTYRWAKARVDGKTKPVLSRHALGLAMDIVSIVDSTGREVVVAKDYPRDDALLVDLERAVGDSGVFRTLLTPKNDPVSHKDHFHLEANPDYSEDRTSS